MDTTGTIDEIERQLKIAAGTILKLARQNRRLQAALQEIITAADSDNGLTAWDGADIARRALEE